LTNLVVAYSGVGRSADAVPAAEEAVTLRREQATTNPAYLPELAIALTNLAVAYRKVGRHAEAIPPFQQAVAAQEQVLGPDHPLTRASRINLTVSYVRAGRWVALWQAHPWRRGGHAD
jgi:tetratricopeptide (TPR) repeat protein